jgi:hypothetical protein
LDKVRDELSELAQIEATVVGSSAVVTTGLSVGYVVWLARGGRLLASLLSSMPAWRAIDPLPVLANFRDSEDGVTEALAARRGISSRLVVPDDSELAASA